MKVLKAMLVGATGLFIFITLLSLLIPAHPKVSRTVVVNTAAKEKVMAQLTDLANWKNWHPVFSSKEVSVTLGKTTAGVGASCDISYNGKTTNLSITNIDTTAGFFKLYTKGEDEISNQVIVTPIPSLQQQKVDWIATTHLHWYPWEKFYAIFIDKLTGPGYELALHGLKNFVEK